MSVWQPIDTAPKDGTRVLAWCAEWTAPSTAQWYSRGWWGLHYQLRRFRYQPTHWMPLPAPPEVQS